MLKRLGLFLTVLMLGVLFSVAINNTSVTNAQPPFASGSWSATFYNNTNFSGAFAANTTYPTLNFNWPGVPTLSDGATPIAGVQADNFSVVFTRQQGFTAGEYLFTMTADDQASLTIDNTPVLNITSAGGTQSARVILESRTYTLRVELIEFEGPAILNLTYPGSGDGGGAPFPGATAFLTPTPTPFPTQTPLPPIPPGAITATVIRASVLNTRDAPTLGGNRIGRILRGETYAIVGRDSDARWFLLQLGGYQGWAYGFYLFVDGNEFTPPIVSGNSVLGLAGQQDFGVRGQTSATVRLRAEPSVASMQTGRITWGGFLPIVGRTADGFWYRVVWKDTVGWAYAPFVDIVEGDINNVPVGQ